MKVVLLACFIKTHPPVYPVSGSWQLAHISGVTSLVHKADALLWALALEVNTGDKQESVRRYCERVICNLSDQGISPSFLFSHLMTKTMTHVTVTHVWWLSYDIHWYTGFEIEDGLSSLITIDQTYQTFIVPIQQVILVLVKGGSIYIIFIYLYTIYIYTKFALYTIYYLLYHVYYSIYGLHF